MNRGIGIIGLSGTNGAGKDLVGELLAKRHNYLFISVTELLRDECRRRGLPVERQHLRAISAEWRRAQGYAVLVDKAIEEFEKVKDRYKGLVMSSLRNPSEADRIHEVGGTMLWVDADPKVRYQRISSGPDRGRAGEDNKTYEQFLAEQEAEMRPPEGGDGATLNMAAVKDRSNLILQNNSDDVEELAAQLEHILGL